MDENKGNISLPIYCIVFCFVLFISITISAPALTMNDEWISANQLYQLGTGQQLITSEEKYGHTEEGESFFFSTRANVFIYGLFLPIVALPAYHVFMFLDMGFRLAVILFWAILPVIISLLIMIYFPKYSKFHGISWPWIPIIAIIPLFLLNLIYYYPFSASGIYDPVESAALVITDNFLLAFLAVLFLFICRIVFNNWFYSLFGTFALLCSSSYLYWGSCAKDHMLAATVFTLVLASALLMVKKENINYGIFTFIGIGLLAWVRPELAFILFLVNICIFYCYYYYSSLNSSDKKKVTVYLLIPLFVLVGGIPFFANNIMVSGDPLTPPFVYALQMSNSNIEGTNWYPDDAKILMESNNSEISPIYYLINYFSPHWNSLITDYLCILFMNNDSINRIAGVFTLCPIFLIGICLYALNYLKPVFICSEKFKKEFLIALAFVVSVFITYTNIFPYLLANPTVTLPDYRHLTPLYAPAVLIGLIAIYRLYNSNTDMVRIFKTTIPISIFTSIIIFLIFLLFPKLIPNVGITDIIAVFAFVMSIIYIFSLYIRKTLNISRRFEIVFLAVTLGLPLFWNTWLIICYTTLKENGYAIWLPLLEYIYSNVFVFI